MVKDFVEKEQPDFVAVTGNVVSGQVYHPHTTSNGWWFTYAYAFFRMLNEAGVPHSFVAGYHDYEGDANEPAMLSLEDTWPLSLTKFNDFTRYGKGLDH